MNKIKIGNIVLNTKVSLSPMAGITDYILRSLVKENAPDCLITTEMISSEALINESKCKKKDLISQNSLIKRAKNHSPISYQLTGHKPDIISAAAKIIEPYADIIDINMGCPVNKVVKGQDGCALMRNPSLAADLVKAIKQTVSCPVSVKFRLGYTQDEMNYVDFGVKMQEAGADFITIHARTRAQMYSGKADWGKIANLVKAVDIPVFANGDIKSIEDAKLCLEMSLADGVAVGRAAMGDVTLIGRIDRYLKTGEAVDCLSLEDNIKNLKELIKREIEFRGEDIGIKFVRKYYPFYISKMQNAAKFRGELVTETSFEKIVEKLDSIVALAV